LNSRSWPNPLLQRILRHIQDKTFDSLLLAQGAGSPVRHMASMTIRALINKKKRMISIIIYSGFAIFLIGIVLGIRSNTFPIIAMVGFGVAFIALGYAFFGIRCPKCKGQWGYIAMYSGNPFAISKKIKFCPYCGVNLDSEVSQLNTER